MRKKSIFQAPDPDGLPTQDQALTFSAMIQESDALLVGEYFLYLSGKNPEMTLAEFHEFYLPQALVLGCSIQMRCAIFAEKNQPPTPSSGHKREA